MEFDKKSFDFWRKRTMLEIGWSSWIGVRGEWRDFTLRADTAWLYDTGPSGLIRFLNLSCAEYTGVSPVLKKLLSKDRQFQESLYPN